MNPKNHNNILRAKVLVVDDDPRLTSVLSKHLMQIGCRCVACNNASEAMVQFAAGSFDLVITDLTMPGIDGTSIVATIRSQSDVPIIVVTGHSTAHGPWINQCRNVTVIQKPFDLEKLIVKMLSFLPAPIVPQPGLKCG